MYRQNKTSLPVRSLIAVVLLLGRNYVPVLVLSLLMKSKFLRPVRWLLVLFGESLLRKAFGRLTTQRLVKATNETVANRS